jgi:hypothetical protein
MVTRRETQIVNSIYSTYNNSHTLTLQSLDLYVVSLLENCGILHFHLVCLVAVVRMVCHKRQCSWISVLVIWKGQCLRHKLGARDSRDCAYIRKEQHNGFLVVCMQNQQSYFAEDGQGKI